MESSRWIDVSILRILHGRQKILVKLLRIDAEGLESLEERLFHRFTALSRPLRGGIAVAIRISSRLRCAGGCAAGRACAIAGILQDAADRILDHLIWVLIRAISLRRLQSAGDGALDLLEQRAATATATAVMVMVAADLAGLAGIG